MDANIMNSCATLEEFFGEYYVENFEDFDGSVSKIEAIRNKKRDWFFYTQDGYIVDESGHALYLIVKKNLLRDNPSLEIKGGDAVDGTSYKYYYELNDVYGVTKDLKVYYCSSGINSIMGVEEKDLDEEDFSRVVIGESSPWADLIPHEGTDGLTVQDLRNVDTLVIDENCGLKSLDEIYRLNTLKNLTIENKTGSEFSLKGLENAYDLDYLCLHKCNLSDYSAIKGLTSLQYLYLYDSCNEEVEKVFNSMSGIDYLKLHYLGIYGTIQYTGVGWPWWGADIPTDILSEVTDINSISLLSEKTKLAVNYMYLNNNKITSVDNLSGFNNITELTLSSNKITNLNGLSGISKILYISAYNNLELSDVSGLSSSNLHYIKLNKTNISTLEGLHGGTDSWILAQNNESLNDISAINNFTSLGGLYLDGCPNISLESVREIRLKWNDIVLARRKIDQKYLEYLQLDDERNLSNKISTDMELYNLIENNIEIKKLNLSGNSSLGNTSFSTLGADIQGKIIEKLGDNLESKTNDSFLRYILSTLPNIENLSLGKISNLKNIDFIKFMKNISELDISGTGITDLSILDSLKEDTDGTNNLSKLGIIVVDNENTDFTTFQKTIEDIYNISTTPYWLNESGYSESCLVVENKLCFNKENIGLNYCDKIYNLKIMGIKSNQISGEIISLSEMNLKNIRAFWFNGRLELPKSIEGVNLTHCDFAFLKETTGEEKCNLTYYTDNNSSETTQGGFDKFLDSLQYCQEEKELEEISIYNVYGNLNLSSNLQNLRNLKIKKFKFYPKYYGISDISGLEGLNVQEGEVNSGYIKELILDGSGNNPENIDVLPNISKANIDTLRLQYLGLRNINGLKGNTSITQLDLTGNKIGSLEAISNFSQLKGLCLKSNNLCNSYFDNVKNQKINNLDILYQLNKAVNPSNSLTYVDLGKNIGIDKTTEEYKKVKASFGSNCIWD